MKNNSPINKIPLINMIPIEELIPPDSTACSWCWKVATVEEASNWLVEGSKGQILSCPECVEEGGNDLLYLSKALGLIDPNTPRKVE